MESSADKETGPRIFMQQPRGMFSLQTETVVLFHYNLYLAVFAHMSGIRTDGIAAFHDTVLKIRIISDVYIV